MEKQKDTALKVNEGIAQPEVINQDAVARLKMAKKAQLSVADYTKGILNSDRTMLSKAITLVESALAEHQELAQQVIANCLPHAG
ncbi:hypothetical protein RZS08_64520, partial [Arthrospira platensis SPKY1]|nr:hypothetical protein [Arthrospira platensis SPKY1]